MVDRASHLTVCYVPGLDRRRLDATSTPTILDALARYPSARVTTLPCTELVPSLLTGVDPGEHGLFQMRLRSDAWGPSARRWHDRLPDLVSTTLQCVRHLAVGYDLAAVPARRRRQWELTRFKYTRRKQSSDVLLDIGGRPSIFATVGAERSRYVFCDRFDRLDALTDELCDPRLALEMVEMYALDLLQHWTLDRPERLASAYAAVDRWFAALERRATAAGRRLVLLVDHGQEPVRGTVDVAGPLAALRLPRDEYAYFLDVPMARFWCRTAQARARIAAMLRGLPNGTLLGWRELADYGITLRGPEYGDLFFVADPGHILFPHDFYHPVGSRFLGAKDRRQLARLLDPRHRGSHGHLPNHPSEEGFLLLCDADAEPLAERMDLTDVAPTLLTLLGVAPPPAMRGRPLFEADGAAVSMR
jgi:hypothetical protein